MEERAQEPPPQRLFIALWPDAEVRAQLVAAARPLAALGGRVIAAANAHVTLVFLGASNGARRGCIEAALAAVRGEPFEFALTRLEWRRRTGIAWLAADGVPAALQALLQALNAALQPCDYIAEARPFRLHVTLARKVRRPVTARTIAPIRWRAQDFCLVSSVLTPEGSQYTVERRWRLG